MNPRAATVRAAKGLLWWWRSVMGDNDYARYQHHMAVRHPGEPVVSERAYWRERYQLAAQNPRTRCC